MLSSRSMTPLPSWEVLGKYFLTTHPTIAVGRRIRWSDVALPRAQTTQTRFRYLSSSSGKEISLNYREKWARSRIAGQPQEVGSVSCCTTAALPKWTKGSTSESIRCCKRVLYCCVHLPLNFCFSICCATYAWSSVIKPLKHPRYDSCLVFFLFLF